LLVAHFADTHLGRILYGIRETEEQIINHFEQAVDQALAEHVDAFIFAGDFLDERKPPIRVLKKAIEIVEKITGRGVAVFMVPGEHDRWTKGDDSPQALFRNAYTPGRSKYFTKKISKNGREYVFTGLDHVYVRGSDEARQALHQRVAEADKAAGRYDILIMHQNIENYFPLDKGLSISNIPATPRYVAMGHLHRRILDKRAVEGKNQVIAYPGSIDVLNVEEAEEARRNGKGFYIVDLTPEEPIVHKINVETTPLEYVETSVKESELKPRIAEALARLAKQVSQGNKGILYVKITMSTGETVSLERIINLIIEEKKKKLPGSQDLIFHKLERKLAQETLEKPSGQLQTPRGELETLADYLARELGAKPEEASKLAEHLSSLKEAFRQGDEESLEQTLEELAKAGFWTRIGIPEEYIKLEEAKPPATGRGEPAARKPSRLTEYFKR